MWSHTLGLVEAFTVKFIQECLPNERFSSVLVRQVELARLQDVVCDDAKLDELSDNRAPRAYLGRAVRARPDTSVFDPVREIVVKADSKLRHRECLSTVHRKTRGCRVVTTLAVDDEIVGDIDLEALAALDQDGATVADAVTLWHELENPTEMLTGDSR